MSYHLLALLAVAGAAACWLALALPELPVLASWSASRLWRLFSVEQVRVDLVQAGLGWLPAGTWIGLRWGVAVLAALIGYMALGLPVIGLVAFLGVYLLLGAALGRRRRTVEAARQLALLDAIRYGISVMAGSGNAMHMVKALATSGPVEARPIFVDLDRDLSSGEETMVKAVERARGRVADPLFDDICLVLLLHWKSGGKLVPALEAVVDDWGETLQLQRDAQAQRAGVDASVQILTAVPFFFLLLIHLLAPRMLAPLGRPRGEAVLAVAAIWMATGHWFLRKITEPPREERITLREGSL